MVVSAGLMIIFSFQLNSVLATTPRGLVARGRLTDSQTVRVSTSCPLSTEACVPCKQGDQYCRMEAGQVFGYKGWACQNNNPGNIRYSEERNRLIVRGGAAPSCGSQGGYMVFSTYQNGRNALKAYVRAIDKGYHSAYPACGGCNLKYFFSRYAPAGDQNDPTSYANNVGNWMGVNPDTTTIAWIVDHRLDDFVDAIQRQEGWFTR